MMARQTVSIFRPGQRRYRRTQRERSALTCWAGRVQPRPHDRFPLTVDRGKRRDGTVTLASQALRQVVVKESQPRVSNSSAR